MDDLPPPSPGALHAGVPHHPGDFVGAFPGRQLPALHDENGGAVPGLPEHGAAGPVCAARPGRDQALYGDRHPGQPGARGLRHSGHVGDSGESAAARGRAADSRPDRPQCDNFYGGVGDGRKTEEIASGVKKTGAKDQQHSLHGRALELHLQGMPVGDYTGVLRQIA